MPKRKTDGDQEAQPTQAISAKPAFEAWFVKHFHGRPYDMNETNRLIAAKDEFLALLDALEG